MGCGLDVGVSFGHWLHSARVATIVPGEGSMVVEGGWEGGKGRGGREVFAVGSQTVTTRGVIRLDW